MMSEMNEDRRSSARKRAQNHFTAAEQRDTAVRQMLDKQSAATDAKITKLRALRLAKEAVDKEEAGRLAAEEAANPTPKPAPRTRKKRVPAA